MKDSTSRINSRLWGKCLHSLTLQDSSGWLAWADRLSAGLGWAEPSARGTEAPSAAHANPYHTLRTSFRLINIMSHCHHKNQQQHQHHSINTRTILVNYVKWCILLCLDNSLFSSLVHFAWIPSIQPNSRPSGYRWRLVLPLSISPSRSSSTITRDCTCLPYLEHFSSALFHSLLLALSFP